MQHTPILALLTFILAFRAFSKPTNEKCSTDRCLNGGKCVEKNEATRCLCSKPFAGRRCELIVREYNNGLVRRVEITGILNETDTSGEASPFGAPYDRVSSTFDYLFDLLKQQFKRYFMEAMRNNTDPIAESELMRRYEVPNDVAIIRQLNQLN